MSKIDDSSNKTVDDEYNYMLVWWHSSWMDSTITWFLLYIMNYILATSVHLYALYISALRNVLTLFVDCFCYCLCDQQPIKAQIIYQIDYKCEYSSKVPIKCVLIILKWIHKSTRTNWTCFRSRNIHIILHCTSQKQKSAICFPTEIWNIVIR